MFAEWLHLIAFPVANVGAFKGIFPTCLIPIKYQIPVLSDIGGEGWLTGFTLESQRLLISCKMNK